MEKISTRVNEKNVIDLDFTVKQNISNLSDYLNKNPENLTACILDRPRHKKIIDELNKLKVNLKLITDGDVSIIFLCLGLSKIHAVKFSGFLFK